MEYFDPKTRPQAIFLDEDALLGAPPDLIRSTATTVFAGLVGAMGQTDINPLAEGDRNHAFRLAHGAYPRLVDELDNPSLRTDLCIAAVLMNRAEDDGARRIRDGAFSGNYAVSTALHVHYPHVGQGESTSVVHAAKMRLSTAIDAQSARQVAEALQVWRAGMDVRSAVCAVADTLEALYTRVGVPTQLRQLDIPREDLRNIARETVKNFNANAGRRSPADQIEDAMRLLEAAY
jgi:alcohol dehydrogenase class IV